MERARRDEGETERNPFEILEGTQSSLSLVHPFPGNTKSIMHEAQKVSERTPCCRPAPAYKVTPTPRLSEFTMLHDTIKKLPNQ